VYPDYEALVYGNRRYTWLETYKRCIKFASALEKHGIGLGDTVSIIAANTPEIFEAHYSIPMTGGVINTINTRLDAETIAYILEHSDAKLLVTDSQFSLTVKKALELYGKKIEVIDIVDDQAIL
jgi:fatty-acyl-CoA synthase